MFMEVVCLHYLETNKTLHIVFFFFLNITKRCPCVLKLSHQLEIMVMVVQPSLHITQMKFEMSALFCKYFTRRAYLFNFYERKLTPKIYLSCFYSDNAFLFIHHYIFICLPLYCFNIHAYQIPHLFFFVPNVKINPMLNYPLLIRVNFCLVHL